MNSTYLVTKHGYEVMRENKLHRYVQHILTNIKEKNDTEYMSSEQMDLSKSISYKTLYETHGERVNEVLRTLLLNGLIYELTKKGDKTTVLN